MSSRLPSIDESVAVPPTPTKNSLDGGEVPAYATGYSSERGVQSRVEELDKEISKADAILAAGRFSEPLVLKVELIKLLVERNKRKASIDDVIKASSLAAEVISAAVSSEDRESAQSFTRRTLEQFSSTGNEEDLIEALRRIIGEMYNVDPSEGDRSRILRVASNSLGHLYEATGDVQVLRKAQKAQEKLEFPRIQRLIKTVLEEPHYVPAGRWWPGLKGARYVFAKGWRMRLELERRVEKVYSIYRSKQMVQPQTFTPYTIREALLNEESYFMRANSMSEYHDLCNALVERIKTGRHDSIHQAVHKQDWASREPEMEASLESHLPGASGTVELNGKDHLPRLSNDAQTKQLPRDSGYGSSSGMDDKGDPADDDIRSIHSVLTNAPRIRLGAEEEENLVSAFATDLCQDMRIEEGERQRMLSRLHTLLKGFSVRLQENQLATHERNAAEFVWQQRENIASQIRKASARSNIPEDDAPKIPSSGGMTVEEKMLHWPVGNSPEPPPPETPPVEQVQDPVPAPPRYQEVRAFLRESAAYSWLLEKARVSASLTDTAGTPVQTINKTMDGLFQAMRERSLAGPVYDARVEMDWDLPGFLRRQKYDTTLEVAVERAITLTGSAQDAQAMTCLEYMSQTWPSGGQEMVRALQQALKSPTLSCQTRLSDGTAVDISLQSPKATIRARGGRAALTELCEQLAWLGAALGAGPDDGATTAQSSRVWIATPSIAAFNAGDLHAKRPSITVRIRFPIRPAPVDAADGTCWHALFHHPVVVDGFPIVARRQSSSGEKGLEMSAGMMSALAECHYATRYAETMVLKGFCTMLVPTVCTGRSVTWHFVYNGDGSWLPYNGFRERCPNVVSSELLNSDVLNSGHMRNFVGWASTIRRNLGTDGMNYADIRPAGAPACSAGLAAEKKLTISVSKLFGTSVSFVRGERDKPVIAPKDPYKSKVNAARRIPVLLYDLETKRGWLVDGASALLHIARTQVVHPPYGEDSQFNDEDLNGGRFKHPCAGDGPDATSNALKDMDNQGHIISSEFAGYDEDNEGKPRRKMAYHCFKNLVSDTWDTFDQIYSRQEEVERSQNQQLKNPLQDSVEGYEYMDLVSLRSSLTRRHVNLHTNGSEWLGFVKRINAITLFARNFEEIYTPAGEARLCVPWSTVPADQEYLAVPVSLLKELKEHTWEEGKIGADTAEIAKRVQWKPSEGAFAQCKGANQDCTRESHHHVQRLTAPPSSATQRVFDIIRPKSDARDEEDSFAMEHGAVIFGRTSSRRLADSGARSSDSGYNSSPAGSPQVAAAADGGSSSINSSSSRRSSLRIASTRTESYRPSACRESRDDSVGTSSSPTTGPLGSDERPATVLGSSGGATPTVPQASSPQPAASRPAPQGSTAARRPFKLRETLFIRKFREWKHRMRTGKTSK